MADAHTRTGSQIVIDALQRAGVDLAFGYPGGAIMPLYDVLLDSPIRHILVRHEQMGIHAADGYARATGRLGCCIATSGPGATNLVTGLATAMADSVPLIAITGQVPTGMIGTDGFQESDVFGIVQTVTKHAYLVRSVGELPDIMEEAIFIARTGRPGPVLVDIPKNVLAGTTNRVSPPLTEVAGYHPEPRLNPTEIAAAHELLRHAQRPVVLVGGGCKLANATDTFRHWCRLSEIPVLTTLNGIGCADPDNPRYFGMVGMHGLRRANRALDTADLIISCGARFDDRVTGKVDEFGRNARIVHVDIDEAEINKIIATDVGVHAHLRTALEAWCRLLEAEPVHVPRTWYDELVAIGDGLQNHDEDPGSTMVAAIDTLDALFALIGRDTIVTTDVGQHQMWAAQRYHPTHPRKFITSGGVGTMGFGLPSAVGAQCACPDQRVVAIVGDGGFQMCLGELATIRRCRLPVKIFVLDNKYLGMVRQWQEMFFAQRYSAVDLSDNPDFAALARVYGLTGVTLNRPDQIDTALREWWECDGPALLHVECPKNENVFPMVPPNAAVGDMLEASR
ncbi:MAG: biosynthetic-type acetolactate synthase large subunit [Phycisphaerales bacterium]|nr:biosynthetic-type acetolactate synthase large subunit [Phycisphaerales bacterium]